MPAPASRQEFAALVNDARRRQHLSIRAVARIAEVPATTAQGWLNGKHFPTPALRGNYLKLLDHLDLADAVPRDLWDLTWGGVEPALKSGRSPYCSRLRYGNKRMASEGSFMLIGVLALARITTMPNEVYAITTTPNATTRRWSKPLPVRRA